MSLRENVKNMDLYEDKGHLGDKREFLTSCNIRFYSHSAGNNVSTIQ